MRVGMGYDVHKLTEGRKLILGGVDIPWEKGLLGHSDADVLIHPVMDALLGAAALGDNGKQFPDTEPAYKGISSIKLLVHVAELLRKQGYAVEMCIRDRNATEDVKEFVNEATKCDFDIDISYNRIIMDAKSLLGILSMDLTRELTVRCYGESQRFNEVMAKFAVA